MKNLNLIFLLLIMSCSNKYQTRAIDLKGIYVAPEGNDQGLGTFNDPYHTIQKALNAASPGNTIYLKKGKYKEQLEITKSGEFNRPIVITAINENEVIIDGEDFSLSETNQKINSALIHLRNVSYIKIENLNLKNFSSKKINSLISAIMVDGYGEDISITNNKIENIKTLVTGKGGDAHGIAVYGTDGIKPLKKINISNNELHDLKLGSSEALVVNGNVEEFSIKNNTIFSVDNIAIDAIGFESKSPNPKNDQARRGIIENNIVYDVSSYGNPAYGNEYSAGGIYVDGGKNILIKNNKIFRSDIGIELASEHKNKATTNITVVGNTLAYNRLAGLAMGGYDLERGQTLNCTISNNIFYKNNSLNGDGGEIYFQYFNFNNVISNNKIEANETNLIISNRDKNFNQGNKFNNNHYYSKETPNQLKFLWKNTMLTGFEEFRKKSGQESQGQFLNSSLSEPTL